MSKQLLGTALATLAIAACAAPAIAGVYKDTDGTTTYVWVDGLTPEGSYDFTISGLNKTRSVTVNACGWASLSFSFGETPPTSVKIANDAAGLSGASAINTSSLPSQSVVCRNGVVVDAAGNPTTATAAFEDQSGRYVFPGFTQNDRKIVEYVGTPNTRTKKADACGLARFLHRADVPASNMTAFSFDGTSYTLAGLTQTREIRCKKYKDGSIRKLIPTVL